MKVGYVKVNKGTLNVLQKIKNILGKIEIIKLNDDYVFCIPVRKKIKRQEKILKKLKNLIKKYRIDKIVFSEELINRKGKIIKKVLKEDSLKIVYGKKILNIMSMDILEYIFNLRNTVINNEDLFFLIKKDEEFDIKFLYKFIEKCKTVNIITNDIEKFRKFQEDLYEKENILITVSNNKIKSLRKAKYIFNINMSNEEIIKYKLNRNAIIINLKDELKDLPNTFEGINVNYINIKIPDEYMEKIEIIDEDEEFDITKIYESILEKRIDKECKKNIIPYNVTLSQKRNIAENIIKEDKIKIIGLIGNNGKIRRKRN